MPRTPSTSAAPGAAPPWAALLALTCCLLAVGCGGEDALPRADAAPPEDAGESDGAAPDPDLGFADAARPDGDPPDAGDAAPPDLGDLDPPDADPPDAGDADPPDLGDLDPPDAAPPTRCAPWVDVPDAELVAALHAHLHETYRPIAVELDLGGRPNRYTTARHRMFTELEWYEDPDQGGGYECVYTGRFVRSPPDREPDDEVMNCEHTWPRARMSPQETLLYSHQQSDVHHLLPTISGANSLRGSDPFGEVAQGRNLDYLPAVSGLDAAGQPVFQPRRERRGDIARVIFYFSVRWGRDISDDEEAALRAWMLDDPVDRRERTRNDGAEAIQGNRNPFVDCPDLVARIADFAAFEPLDTDENLPAP